MKDQRALRTVGLSSRRSESSVSWQCAARNATGGEPISGRYAGVLLTKVRYRGIANWRDAQSPKRKRDL